VNGHFRSPELLRLAAGHDCTLRIEGLCVTGPCVSAHSNQSCHGKGRSIKAHDCFIAFACDPCHRELDQGKRFTREQKIEIWTRGHNETLPILMAEILETKAERRPRAEAAKPTKTLPRNGTDLLPKIVPRRFAA
jgi:hypothetical protein